jgi:UDP-glucose 4-epimerase
MQLLADRSKLHTATGWEPGHTLEEGLAITAKWFAEPSNLARYKVDQYTI